MNATAVLTRAQAGLMFNEHPIKTIQRDGQIWMSGEEIGRALEYAAPTVSVTRLYNRAADEFTGSMTKIFKVATAGGRQAVRFFSLRGAHLLAMFARTGKAKAFRIWVLNILDVEVAKPVKEQVKSYYYPLQSCKPESSIDRFDHQAQFDAKTLDDPRNPAPELELIKQLERDGHDVTGARVRILSMRHQLKHLLMAKTRMATWEDRLLRLADELKNYQRDQGLGVLFSGEVQEARAFGFEAQHPRWESTLTARTNDQRGSV